MWLLQLMRRLRCYTGTLVNLGLKDTYSEKDLETSIIIELQRLITEMGSEFAFLARQKRITINNRDYHETIARNKLYSWI